MLNLFFFVGISADKQLNAGTMKLERVEKLRKLLKLTEQYRRRNQYE